MSGVATAAVVGAGLSYAASENAANAAGDAADASSAAARYQADLQKQMYDQTRKDQGPWRDAGQNALSALMFGSGLSQSYSPYEFASGGAHGQLSYDDMSGDGFGPNADLYAIDPAYRAAYDKVQQEHYAAYGGDPSFAERSDLTAWNRAIANIYGLDAENERRKTAEAGKDYTTGLTSATGINSGSLLRDFTAADFEADPGYDFRQKEGMQALDRGAAAKGGLLSGAAIKAAQRFGQDLASQEYQNAYNRFNTNQTNKFNRLASIAGVGQTANNALQTAGTNYANAMTGISANDATNQGNALLAMGNARASGYQGFANAASGAFANWPKQPTTPASTLPQQTWPQQQPTYGTGIGQLGSGTYNL